MIPAWALLLPAVWLASVAVRLIVNGRAIRRLEAAHAAGLRGDAALREALRPALKVHCPREATSGPNG